MLPVVGCHCQWASGSATNSLAARTPRLSKITDWDLTHFSNTFLSGSLSALSHSQHHPRLPKSALSKRSLPTTTFCHRTLTTGPRSALRSTPVRRHTTSTMASSTLDPTQQWTATKVRDTFLKYFEERGHTFGEFQCKSMPLRPVLADLAHQSNPPPSCRCPIRPFSSPMPA